MKADIIIRIQSPQDPEQAVEMKIGNATLELISPDNVIGELAAMYLEQFAQKPQPQKA